MTTYIAVDIGGTRMRAASYSADSLTPLKIDRIKTRKVGSPPEERLIKLLGRIWPEADPVAAIGMTAPGPLDPTTGILVKAPNIPEWIDFPLADYVNQHFHVPVLLGNDANLAALGEWKFGAGRGHHHLLYLTISTGIGSGVIVNDSLLVGAHGYAAELGHITVLPDGPICNCGQRGHLEAIASGTAIANWVKTEIARGIPSSLTVIEELSAQTIAEAAQQGDQLAQEAFQRAGTYLGQAIADFLTVFNPTIVVLGGGVSLSYDLFSESLQSAMRQHAFDENYLDDLTITLAELGDDAGLMGALALARDGHC
jgi:glucokinase